MKTLKITLLALLLFILTAPLAFAEMMLFVGDGCPHCTVVEEYLEDNDISSQFDISINEVWYNTDNQKLYEEKALELGYDRGGVPFLVDGNEYRVGDTPIIAYIEEKVQTNNVLKASVVDADENPEPTLISAEDSADIATNGVTKDYQTIMIIAGAIVLLGFGFVLFRKK
jgi:glutaredoxin